MAGRPTKEGLDYFELDCHMEDKIELIEAEFGLKGFAVVVKLYQSIYSKFGYYCEWTPSTSVLWAHRLGCAKGVDYKNSGNLDKVSAKGALPGFPQNLINEIVAASIRRNIFSKELFDKYHILTSSGIQKRYLNAVSKREKVEMKKEYLLISIPKNRQNVVINSIFDDFDAIFGVGNSQSKGKYINTLTNVSVVHSGEKSLESNDTKKNHNEADELFDELWGMYPVKRGKSSVSKTSKDRLLKLGREKMLRAIKRYLDECKSVNRILQNGSTFFNRGYLDYLDDDFEPLKPDRKPAQAKLGMSRNTDLNSIVMNGMVKMFGEE